MKTEKMKLTTSPRIRNKIASIMKKMGFQSEDLFLRYCLAKAYRPYATESQKKQLSKEIQLIDRYKKEQAKKK